jgi:DNA-binding transcriptional LysR family regulator
MKDLRSLESFLQTVEAGSFSAAAGVMGLTPAAVSKHVQKFERTLGVRLFQRTTRSLTVTEAGERLYVETAGPARALEQAMATLTERNAQPAGTLRVSVAPGFCRQHILPLMPEFLASYPDIRLDWSLENRHVDLVREGFDAAIGSGLEDDANLVARKLLSIDLMTVGAPVYLAARGVPQSLADLAQHDCIRLRSATSGRLRDWSFQVGDESVTVPVDGRIVFTDLDAICDAALGGLGLARLGAYHVGHYISSGQLQPVLQQHPFTSGTICVYYAHYRLIPPKVRAFVDFLSERFPAPDNVAKASSFSG